MSFLPSALLSLALAATLGAQTIQLPTLPYAGGEDNLPLATSPTRYQQWYSAADLTATALLPVRIRALAFLAGSTLQTGSTVDIEIRMARLALGQLPSTTFDNNLVNSNTLVFPRAVVTLAANPNPGARVFTFTFAREFAWDGASGIVIDVKVFGNGNGNQSYLYACRTALSATGRTMRLFAPGNPATLQVATISQNGVGLITEFDYADGLTVSYGTGCPGSGTLVPVAATSGGLPIPPNGAWAQTVGSVLPMAPAVLVAGTSRTIYNGVPLPFDLGLLGYSGCFLRAEPVVFLPAMATAGGTATMPLPLPGITMRRRQMFTQWFVLDAGAPNGVLAASQGLWHVFG